MRLLVLNGPNLNLLGTREPEIYGTDTLEDIERRIEGWAQTLGVEIETAQTNHEGVLVDHIQRTDVDGIVINPAGYSYTSRAITDAISAVATPVVEVHISNIKEREPWRADSLVTPVADYTIYGRGIVGYQHAMRHLVNSAAHPFETVAYGDNPDQVGDVRGGGDRLIILIHGGFWLGQWTRDTMESLAVDLGRAGFSTWNIEYRRLGGGGGWPGSFDDVLAALNHAPELGLAREGTTIVGHSAGAHMAMWAAQRAQPPVQRVVALAPVVDLGAHAISGGFASEVARELVGDGAPPIIGTGGVPTTLVHGSADRHVPIGHSEALADAEGLDLITVDSGHFDLLDPAREPWPVVKELLIG